MTQLPSPATNTLRFTQLSDSDIDIDETIISSEKSEENRGIQPLWSELAKANPERVIWIRRANKESIYVRRGTENETHISLRDEQSIANFFSRKKFLIDVTGLTNDVWAPLFKSIYERKIPIRVLYTEPETYKPHPSPASTGTFDLSVTFEGLSPLPGFARLSGPENEEKCLFIATLGFEGNRPEYLVAQLDPTPKVIPIVGAPGFQLEYPTFTVGCNRFFLDEYHAHPEMRYARASCPFDIFHSLRAIHNEYPEHYLYLALVGTKPHAIGSILFAIKHPEITEIMFDYPIKKDGRTSGMGIIHIYDLEKVDAH